MGERIVLAMRGGVDSSAAAVLLKRQGYEVIGLFMRSGATEDFACHSGSGPALPVVSAKANKQGCCSAVDAADARRVADALDIPFHALNFQQAFGRIKDYFADEYLAGRTPNPCVMCNNWLKFGRLWEFAQQVGASRMATGHYARIQSTPSGPALIRGRDLSKDQSYVLFGIARDLLDKVVFPVGDFAKPEIRELAAESGLRVAQKPDSQEICFVPDNDYAAFLKRHRGVENTAGDFVDPTGRVLGQHPGFERFTIGQRRGLGITFGEPRFVIRIDAASRQVVLGTMADLACSGLEADRLNFHTDLPETFRCRAQIRYQHRAAEATAHRMGDTLTIAFDEPQFGVAPGQAVVLYDEDRLLGGGWIRQGHAQPPTAAVESGSTPVVPLHTSPAL